jgi:hypothetical protein
MDTVGLKKSRQILSIWENGREGAGIKILPPYVPGHLTTVIKSGDFEITNRPGLAVRPDKDKITTRMRLEESRVTRIVLPRLEVTGLFMKRAVCFTDLNSWWEKKINGTQPPDD